MQRAKLECASESEALCELTHGEQEDVISASGLHILTLPSSVRRRLLSCSLAEKASSKVNHRARVAGIAEKKKLGELHNVIIDECCFFAPFSLNALFSDG